MVVTMKNVRGWPAPEKVHYSPLKEDPAVRLVGIVLTRCGVEVDAITIKIAIITDQQDFDRGIRHERTMNIVSGNRLKSKLFEVNSAIARNHDGSSDALGSECLRQRAQHIAQPPSLCKGHSLGRNHHNVKWIHIRRETRIRPSPGAFLGASPCRARASPSTRLPVPLRGEWRGQQL